MAVIARHRRRSPAASAAAGGDLEVCNWRGEEGRRSAHSQIEQYTTSSPPSTSPSFQANSRASGGMADSATSTPTHSPSPHSTPPMYRTTALNRIGRSTRTVTMQGMPERRVVPGKPGFCTAEDEGSGGSTALALAFKLGVGRGVGVPLALTLLTGDLTELTEVVGLRVDALVEATELGRLDAGGARTEVMEVAEGGRRRVAVDLVELTEGGRLVGAGSTALSLPLTEAGVVLGAREGVVEVVRGRLIAGVSGFAAVRVVVVGRGVEAVDASDEVEGRDASEGASDGGRRVVDVTLARGLAGTPLLVDALALALGDAAAAFGLVLAADRALTDAAVEASEAADDLADRVGGLADAPLRVAEGVELVDGVGAGFGAEATARAGPRARGADELTAEGSGGAGLGEADGGGRPGRVAPLGAGAPRDPAALTAPARSAVALPVVGRGGTAVDALDVEATLGVRVAVVAVVMREALLVVEGRGVRVVAGAVAAAVGGRVTGRGWRC